MTDTGIRRRLEALKQELVTLREGAADNRRPVELDQQSVGRLSRQDALQMQAMAQAADAQRGLQVRRLDAALTRLAAGDYGFCNDCGEAIPAARLALDPCAAVCVACADERQ
ncbi:TraR/DksA C4-type zinc finger protein [uncultured Brevundimonas sp.]|uniref:TraR/DksA family transcriptional regulator n=1 Tax=uncultured Brevundimonas sp. TaxID=213418 RepID=UPI0030EB1C21|tara:strand:- start:2563 stop:2898 length:336 start_codon:yes stop_codon:yes gene_type:complete